MDGNAVGGGVADEDILHCIAGGLVGADGEAGDVAIASGATGETGITVTGDAGTSDIFIAEVHSLTQGTSFTHHEDSDIAVGGVVEGGGELNLVEAVGIEGLGAAVDQRHVGAGDGIVGIVEAALGGRLHIDLDGHRGVVVRSIVPGEALNLTSIADIEVLVVEELGSLEDLPAGTVDVARTGVGGKRGVVGGRGAGAVGGLHRVGVAAGAADGTHKVGAHSGAVLNRSGVGDKGTHMERIELVAGETGDVVVGIAAGVLHSRGSPAVVAALRHNNVLIAVGTFGGGPGSLGSGGGDVAHNGLGGSSRDGGSHKRCAEEINLRQERCSATCASEIIVVRARAITAGAGGTNTIERSIVITSDIFGVSLNSNQEVAASVGEGGGESNIETIGGVDLTTEQSAVKHGGGIINIKE